MDAHLRRKLDQGLKPLVNTRDVGERKNLLAAIEAFIQGDRVELHVVGGGFELQTTYDFFELYTRVALEGRKSFCTEEDVAIALVALKAGYFIQWFAKAPSDLTSGGAFMLCVVGKSSYQGIFWRRISLTRDC